MWRSNGKHVKVTEPVYMRCTLKTKLCWWALLQVSGAGGLRQRARRSCCTAGCCVLGCPSMAPTPSRNVACPTWRTLVGRGPPQWPHGAGSWAERSRLERVKGCGKHNKIHKYEFNVIFPAKHLTLSFQFPLIKLMQHRFYPFNVFCIHAFLTYQSSLMVLAGQPLQTPHSLISAVERQHIPERTQL